MNCYRNAAKPVVDTGRKRNEIKKIKQEEEKEYVLDPKPLSLTLGKYT